MSSRRAHLKSRTGCQQCKKRRIKCDEHAPWCQRCAERGLDCSYKELQGAIDKLQLLTAPENARYGPSASDTCSKSSQPRPDALLERTTVSVPEEVVESRRDIGPFTLQDFALFHHFLLHTFQTIGPIDRDHTVWKTQAPELAQSYPFLMHAILGVAAAHRSSLDGLLHSTGIDTARKHYTAALRLFRTQVSEVGTTDAGCAFLCYAMLISVLFLSLECERQHDGDPIDDFANLLNILQRSSSVLESVKPAVNDTAYGLLLPGPSRGEAHSLPEDLGRSLQRIESLIQSPDTTDPPATTVELFDALIKLRTYHTYQPLHPITGATLLTWPMTVVPTFAEQVRRRHPAALSMTASWAAPFYHSPGKWYVGKWPERLITSISSNLQALGKAELVAWPLAQTIAKAPG
ncbi:hypothetical protein BAUCODRAFT_575987 [Baudoinia panamericana UAMH 10762]|uniref:Zn(2)-C6 fungal-type domain-containing protein n=1 Tax=Baudoinia panamericana (strain UAMH 10762) TaxID=717646 RepID=M2MXP1_BAUPA|nr:uncharacterized protein BAUCODRAFT_575987 [Baudoinia panamericana UAMH 10762]EMC96338.1 hypothetical protein BAUCODRAFT_575987 [Baudoinia panamericana UAMH 10762]